jgi:hypothetical protein
MVVSSNVKTVGGLILNVLIDHLTHARCIDQVSLCRFRLVCAHFIRDVLVTPSLTKRLSSVHISGVLLLTLRIKPKLIYEDVIGS